MENPFRSASSAQRRPDSGLEAGPGRGRGAVRWHPSGAAGLVLAGAQGHADHQAARTADADDEQDPGVPTDGAHHSRTRPSWLRTANRALSSSRALSATTSPGMASHSLPPRTGRICTRPPISPMTTPMRPEALSFATSPTTGLVCWLLAMHTSLAIRSPLPKGQPDYPTWVTSRQVENPRRCVALAVWELARCPSPTGRRSCLPGCSRTPT